MTVAEGRGGQQIQREAKFWAKEAQGEKQVSGVLLRGELRHKLEGFALQMRRDICLI